MPTMSNVNQIFKLSQYYNFMCDCDCVLIFSIFVIFITQFFKRILFNVLESWIPTLTSPNYPQPAIFYTDIPSCRWHFESLLKDQSTQWTAKGRMAVAPLHMSIGGNGVGSIITSDTKMGGIDPDSQTPNIQSQKVHFDAIQVWRGTNLNFNFWVWNLIYFLTKINI